MNNENAQSGVDQVDEADQSDNAANKLRWKCRRGMKELDVVLTHYLQHHYSSAEPAVQQAFETILDMQDPELYFLLLGNTDTDDHDIATVIEVLRRAPRS